jgi:hypothetical protein
MKYLFVSNGVQMNPEDLRRHAEILTEETMGQALKWNEMRHFLIAIGRTLGNSEQGMSIYLMQELQGVMDASAAHSSSTALKHYAVERCIGSGMQRQLVHMYLVVARLWHERLGMSISDGERSAQSLSSVHKCIECGSEPAILCPACGDLSYAKKTKQGNDYTF